MTKELYAQRISRVFVGAMMGGFVGCGSGESGDNGMVVDTAASAPAPVSSALDDHIDSTGIRLLEGFPVSVVEAMERPGRDLAERILKSKDSAVANALQGVVSRSRIWPRATRVRIAFNGGSLAVRKLIANAAAEWERSTGLTLDFWTDSSQTLFREWGAGDVVYQGDIRIGFERGENGGYWSMVGMSSVDPLQRRAGETSLNLEGFDVQPPREWRQIVLHEFGHAMGFQHEHQSPFSTCEVEFRWHDEPGYVPTTDSRLGGAFVQDVNGRRPGIYRYLGGPPNNWKSDRVNFNLKRLAFDKDLATTAFDPASIMKYYFEPDMFVRGRASQCFSEPNVGLSAQDRSVASAVYSFAASSPQAQEAALAAAARRTADSLGLSSNDRVAMTREVVRIRAEQLRSVRNFRE